MGLERQDEKGRRGAACGPQSIQREENAGGKKKRGRNGIRKHDSASSSFSLAFFCVWAPVGVFLSPSPPLSMP